MHNNTLRSGERSSEHKEMEFDWWEAIERMKKTDINADKETMAIYREIFEYGECYLEAKLEGYYEFKNHIIAKDALEELNNLDMARLGQILRGDYEKSGIFEILKHNWEVLKDQEMLNVFTKAFRKQITQEGVIGFFSFAYIILIIYGDIDILEYIERTILALSTNKSLFLHTGVHEWNYLVELSSIAKNNFESDFIPDYSSVLNYLHALFIYVNIEGTYYNRKISEMVSELNKIKDVPDMQNGVFVLAVSVISRDSKYIKDFEDILHTAIKGDAREVDGCMSDEIQLTEHSTLIFHSVIQFYVISYPIYHSLGLEYEYYKFITPLKNEYYKRELFKVMLANSKRIEINKDFILKFPFFIDLIVNLMGSHSSYSLSLNELCQIFVSKCVLSTCNYVLCSACDSNTLIYPLINIWLQILMVICEDTGGMENIERINGFLTLLYFDVGPFLLKYNTSACYELYMKFRKTLTKLFLTNQPTLLVNDLYTEKFVYVNIIKRSHRKSNFQLKDIDNTVLKKIACMHYSFAKKFRSNSKYFHYYIDLICNLDYISFDLYGMIFDMLKLKIEVEFLLPKIPVLLQKINLQSIDFETNYILDLKWIPIFRDLGIVDFTVLKKEIIVMSIQYLLKNNIYINSAKMNTIKQFLNETGIQVNIGGKIRRN